MGHLGRRVRYQLCSPDSSGSLRSGARWAKCRRAPLRRLRVAATRITSSIIALSPVDVNLPNYPNNANLPQVAKNQQPMQIMGIPVFVKRQEMDTSSAAAGVAELIVDSGRKQGMRRPLNKPITIIGSTKGCDVRLDVPNVRPIHWMIAWCRGASSSVVVRTIHFINGEPVATLLLNDGDVLAVGPFKFKVHSTAPLAEPVEEDVPAPASDPIPLRQDLPGNASPPDPDPNGEKSSPAPGSAPSTGRSSRAIFAASAA